MKPSFIQKRISAVSLWTVNLTGLNLTCETQGFMVNKRKYLAHCLCEYWYTLTVEAIGTLSTTMVGRTVPQAPYWTTILMLLLCVEVCKRCWGRVIAWNIAVRVGFNDSPDSFASSHLFQSRNHFCDCTIQIREARISIIIAKNTIYMFSLLFL